MCMEAAYNTTLNDSRSGILAAPALNDNRTLAAMGRQHDTPVGPLSRGTRSAQWVRRFTLGAAAALALILAPGLVDLQAVQLGVAQPLRSVGQSASAPQAAPAAVAPASTVQEDATRAPAAFSDALAAAPAGAQCNVQAHSCSVAAHDGAQAAPHTAVAYGGSQSRRGGSHNPRL